MKKIKSIIGIILCISIAVCLCACGREQLEKRTEDVTETSTIIDTKGVSETNEVETTKQKRCCFC